MPGQGPLGLPAFYDLPAGHWMGLRDLQPHRKRRRRMRHRTARSNGCVANKTALAVACSLARAAEKSWCRLDGYNQLLPKFILGIKFVGGIQAVRQLPRAAV